MSKNINYTKRSFEGIKDELIKFSNQYYPELSNNFDDHSVGSWFIDLCAATADSLNFAIDRNFQETQIDSATLKSSVLNNARMNGVKIPGRKPSMCEVKFSCELPLDNNNAGLPNFEEYAPIIKRGAIVACGSYTFELQEDLDFSKQFNENGYSNRTFIPKRDSNGIVTSYIVSKSALVFNGRTKIYKKVLGKEDVKPFMEIILPDKDVMNVESVIFVNSNNLTSNPPTNEFFNEKEEHDYKGSTIYRYFEVNSLADQFRFGVDIDVQVKKFDNLNTSCSQISKGKWYFIENKFITEYTDNNYLKLTFGNKTKKLELPQNQSSYSDYTMSYIMENSLLGKMPLEGWTMFVMYRVGGGMETNIGVNSLNTISYINIEMPNGGEKQTQNKVKSSMTVTNLTSGLGGKDSPSVDEIKYLTKYTIGSQERCVTLQDYISRIMLLPPKFGCPFRLNAIEENNKVVIPMLMCTNKGKLDNRLDSNIYENIIEYLKHYKSLGDYVELRSGKIYNVQFILDLFVDKSYSSNDVAYNVITLIRDYMDINKHQMGEDIFIGDLQKEITTIDGVYSIINMKIKNVFSGSYFNEYANKDENDYIDYINNNGVLTPNYDGMFEIKDPNKDIILNIRLI